jgi:hypothetical protein
MLLALSARPALARPLFTLPARAYALLRALGRSLSAPLRRGRS